VKRKITAFSLLALLLAFAACGDANKANKAESMIADYMEQNMQGGKVTEREYSRLDSTFHVRQKAIMNMRNAQVDGYKQSSATPTAPTKKLLYMSIKYKLDGKPRKQTFYFDEQLTGIVCFKDN